MTASELGMLTVNVSDELTFVDPTQPNPQNVIVQIFAVDNPSFTRIANTNDGSVTFSDLPPGTYRVAVQAPGHAPETALVDVVAGLTAVQDVFIPISEIAATHSVTPVEFEDRYTLEITSDFEVDLPAAPPAIAQSTSASVASTGVVTTPSTVTVATQQVLTATRTGFKALIEMVAVPALDGVPATVNFEILDVNGMPVPPEFFNISAPEITGHTSTGGNGFLFNAAGGTFEFTVVPTAFANVTETTFFRGSGSVTYEETPGTFVTYPLLDDYIEVLPPAKLDLDIVPQPIIGGDDLTTPQVELPGVGDLEIAVDSIGLGEARNLSLTASQPQITQNPDGTPLAHTIDGSLVGGGPLLPSLVANLGDLDSGTSETAAWRILSNLAGTFTDHSFRLTHDTASSFGKDPLLTAIRLFDDFYGHGSINDDIYLGLSGSDTYFGSYGNDRLDGKADDDMLDGEDGQDTLIGGSGNDTLLGGDGDDTLNGQTGDDSLDGGSDNDRLFGRSGEDTLIGGSGKDRLSGGDDADTLLGGEGNDSAYGGDGADSIRGDGGGDLANGGGGDDTIDGGKSDDTLNGGSDNDLVIGGSGNDRLIGASGLDTLQGGEDLDTLLGGAGDDVLSGDAGDDLLNGQSGNDTLFGGDHNDSLFGGAGSDSLKGGVGADLLGGGSDNDTLNGGEENDTLNGGDGDDSLEGGDGKDRLDGSVGSDTLTGGAGADTFVFGHNGAASNGDLDVVTDLNFTEDLLLIRAIAGNAQFSITSKEQLLGVSFSGITVTETGNGTLMEFDELNGATHSVLLILS